MTRKNTSIVKATFQYMTAKSFRRLSIDDKREWQSYIHQHPDALPYHDYGWGQTIQSTYGHQALYFGAWKNGALAAVLPLIAINKPFFKPLYVSLPFCDAGGCLADSSDIADELITFTQSQLTSPTPAKIEIRTAGRALSPQELAGKSKVSMRMPIPDNSEALFASFKSKLRSQIKKAEKNGLTYRVASSREQISAFFKVFAHNMHKLGSPVHSPQLFHHLADYFGDNMWVSIVYKDNFPIGGGIVLKNRQVASIPWASTLSTHNRLAPNMLLYWSLLSKVAEQNIPYFDFGRSTPEEGTYKFKSQWGAQPYDLTWNSVPCNDLRTNEKEQKSALRASAEKCWQHLPLKIANVMGPHIRRYISL